MRDTPTEKLYFSDAPVWKRFLAFVIDNVLFIYALLFFGKYFGPQNGAFWLVFRYYTVPLVFIILQAFLISKIQRTVGSRFLGIKIVGKGNKNLGFLRSLFRAIIIYLISPINFSALGSGYFGLLLCFLSIFLKLDRKTNMKRHVFDMIAGSYVIIDKDIKQFERP